MNTNIALLIIYNHRYDKNISKLDIIYEGRFSNVYHIVPFYDGDKENVISVYDTSFCFGGYIAQAYEKVKHLAYTHYYVVADDMIINPKLNENNLFIETGIDENQNFLPNIVEFSKMHKRWKHNLDAIMWTNYKSGAEIFNILPKKEDAINHLKSLGLYSIDMPLSTFWKSFVNTSLAKRRTCDIVICLYKKIKNIFRRYQLEYPMVGGYIDTCLLTSETMPKICQYVGALSATDLFVELSLPTAIVLASHNIITEEKLKLKGEKYWEKNIKLFEDKYSKDLDKLIDNYPNDTFYIHPVKLSKWKSPYF